MAELRSTFQFSTIRLPVRFTMSAVSLHCCLIISLIASRIVGRAHLMFLRNFGFSPRRALFVAATAMLVLGQAGCGSSGDGGRTQTPAGGTTQTPGGGTTQTPGGGTTQTPAGETPVRVSQDKGTLPSGIVYLAEDFTADSASSAFSNAASDGVKLRLDWSAIETSENVYDWSVIDAYLAQAAATGKFLSVSVRAGIRSPDWLYAKAGIESLTLPGSPVSLMPVPWNAVFLQQWGNFWAAFGARYDSNKSLASVTVTGLGKGAEPIIPDGTVFTANSRLFGLSDLADWEVGAMAIIDLYAAALPVTPFVMPLHHIIPPNNTWSNLKRVTDHGFSAYGARFGIENHGLKATTSTDRRADFDFEIHLEIQARSKTRLVGYQMTCSTISNSVCDPSFVDGTLEQALNAGASLGAYYVEVYANDCNNGNNFSVLRAAASRLKANVP